MDASIAEISLLNLSWIFIPVCAVLFLLQRWSIRITSSINGLIRMFIQLLLIGYALNFMFSTDHPGLIACILMFMLTAAALIALRPLPEKTISLFKKSLLAIICGSMPTLILVSQLVLYLPSWYEPRYIIPLAGMIFANSMNAVSLAAERFFSEMSLGKPYNEARGIALNAALIPITNSLFAVGLVSLPGMMTGQILSGISPLIAARYQIMVMCMIFGSAGLSSATFLHLQKQKQLSL